MGRAIGILTGEPAARGIGPEWLTIRELFSNPPVTGDNYNPYLRRVSRQLIRGSQPSEALVRYLRDVGIDAGDGSGRRQKLGAMINLRIESDEDRAVCEKLKLPYFLIGIPDTKPPTIQQALDFLNILVDLKGALAMVHCLVGVGRTGCMVAVARIALEGWSVEDALADAQKHGMDSEEQFAFIRRFARMLERGAIRRGPDGHFYLRESRAKSRG